MVERATEGHFLEPALFVGTSNEMRVNREEIFGPIASVVRAAEPTRPSATTPSTACSRRMHDLARAGEPLPRRVAGGHRARNLPTAGVDDHVPFGGTKGSSSGSREQGRYAVEFVTTVNGVRSALILISRA